MCRRKKNKKKNVFNSIDHGIEHPTRMKSRSNHEIVLKYVSRSAYPHLNGNNEKKIFLN